MRILQQRRRDLPTASRHSHQPSHCVNWGIPNVNARIGSTNRLDKRCDVVALFGDAQTGVVACRQTQQPRLTM
jgi:hypothetical protein